MPRCGSAGGITLPWNAKSFKSRHAHGLSGKQAGKAARQANAILRSGADEGVAIATAIKHAKGRARGGSVGPVPRPRGPTTEGIDREPEPLLNPIRDPKSGGRGIVPYQRGGRMGGPPGGPGQYLTGEVGPELMVPSDGSPPAMVGRRGPEVIRPTKRGSIVPNHELRRLGKKYARRQGGGPVAPDTPQAGFRSPQVERLQKRGIISNKAKEKRLGARPGASRHGWSKTETETTPIDAATR